MALLESRFRLCTEFLLKLLKTFVSNLTNFFFWNSRTRRFHSVFSSTIVFVRVRAREPKHIVTCIKRHKFCFPRLFLVLEIGNYAKYKKSTPLYCVAVKFFLDDGIWEWEIGAFFIARSMVCCVCVRVCFFSVCALEFREKEEQFGLHSECAVLIWSIAWDLFIY